MQQGREDSETLPEAPVPLFCLPASHPYPGTQRERVVRDRQTGHRERSREGLTCWQRWTPEGQEKKQPSPGHGPFDRRQSDSCRPEVWAGEQAPKSCLPDHRPSCIYATLPRRHFPPQGPLPLHLSPKPHPLSCARELRLPLPQQELRLPLPQLSTHTPSHLKSTLPSLAMPSVWYRARGSMSRA